jgi:hypothetical protein
MQPISISKLQADIQIPDWIIWIQCIAFIVLYAVWGIPETMGFRNTALITGAVLSLYPIYRFRHYFLQVNAIPIWLVALLFVWATLHLFMFSQEYSLQLLEFRRIWRYAAIAVIFAIGLGLSLASANTNQGRWWALIYFGLCSPVLIYLLKYTLTTYEVQLGIQVPASLKIYFGSQPHYVPKSDYIAFCLPVLAIALGRMKSTLLNEWFGWRQLFATLVHLLVITAILFLFYIQNAKNGMVYAALLCLIFGLFIVFSKTYRVNFWRNTVIFLVALGIFAAAIYPHFKKNDSWRTLLADTKVAVQLDRYQQWKYAGAKGYPNNEFGKMVSVTNYERAAWFLVGSKLAIESPFGYGLIEDSFKKMAKAKWPEVSPNLSHSHSGWLDVILAVGFPGFLLVMGSLLMTMRNSKYVQPPWKEITLWALLANLFLWCTTEVSATVTFVTLLFWIVLASALALPYIRLKNTTT